MAITYNPAIKTVWGIHRVVLGTLEFDGSYPAGGEPFTVAGLSGGYFASSSPYEVFCILEPTVGYTFLFRPDTGKIQVYSTAATEVSNGTDLSDIHTAKYLLIGT
jgi:hypothetical protein